MPHRKKQRQPVADAVWSIDFSVNDWHGVVTPGERGDFPFTGRVTGRGSRFEKFQRPCHPVTILGSLNSR